jgi:HTH domain
VTPRVLALARAEAHLIERLGKIEVRLGDDPASWQEYAAIASALAVIVPQLAPQAIAPLLSQKELAARLSISTRTIRRRIASGELPRKRKQ